MQHSENLPRDVSSVGGLPVPIQVATPDGSSFQFPDGTTHDTIKGVLDNHFGYNRQDDITKLSDAELQSLANGNRPTGQLDIAALSDDELKRLHAENESKNVSTAGD